MEIDGNKITSKYVTQEHLHHRWLKNQKKFVSEAFNKPKKSRQNNKNTFPYEMIAGKSPYLRPFLSKFLHQILNRKQ